MYLLFLQHTSLNDDVAKTSFNTGNMSCDTGKTSCDTRKTSCDNDKTSKLCHPKEKWKRLSGHTRLYPYMYNYGINDF